MRLILIVRSDRISLSTPANWEFSLIRKALELRDTPLIVAIDILTPKALQPRHSVLDPELCIRVDITDAAFLTIAIECARKHNDDARPAALCRLPARGRAVRAEADGQRDPCLMNGRIGAVVR
jgi:hypothetical protein